MKKQKGIVKAIAMVSQLGITIMVPIFLCVFVGGWLDSKLGTKFLTVLGIFLGIVVAFRNVYLITRTFYIKDKEREDAQLKYIQNLKIEAKKRMNQENGYSKEINDTFEEWKSNRQDDKK